MVIFDANFLMLAMRPNIPASVDKAKERVTQLVNDLQEKGERIVVPTPVLTEFLVHAENAASVYLDELQKSARFKIAPFGVKAAVDVAIIIAAAVTKKQKRDGAKGTWAKVNFDRQIAAIGKAEGAHTIYTDDGDLGAFAKKFGIKPVTLADLPVPPSKTPLLDILDEIEEQEGERDEQTTEGAHPRSAEVRGGGSGFTESETRTKTAEAGAESSGNQAQGDDKTQDD